MTKILILLSDNINKDKTEFLEYTSKKVHEYKIDTTVLVGEKPTLDLIKEIRENHQKKYSEEIHLNVLILQNLNDMNYLFNRFKFKIKEFPNSEIVTDITYGTSKVSAIAILISKLYGLKVQDKLEIMDTSKYEDFDVIEHSTNSNKPMYYIKMLFNNYHYKLAKDILHKNYNPQDKTENMFGLMIDIYEKWDSFEYENYDFTKIQSFFVNLKEKLQENKKAINILMNKNNEKYNSYKIADLINNAIRRIEQDRYDDAIIRLYRVLELIGEAELYEKYGIRKTDIHLDDIEKLDIEKNAKINIKRRLDYKYPRYQIPLTTTYFLLQKLYNNVGLYYLRNKQKYQELFQKRNVSVLVHGDHRYEISEINEMLEKVTELALVYDENISKYMTQLEFPTFKI